VSSFLQQVINGLQLGSVYALIALGYTLVYGIIRLINFAHGDVFMIGAYLGFYAILRFHMPFPIALLFAMVGAVLCAMRRKLPVLSPRWVFLYSWKISAV
jgi:branched-chain amino acid transport system permease protein